MLRLYDLWALNRPDDIKMGFSEDRAKGKFGPFYLLVAENPYVLWDAAEDWKSAWKSVGSDIARIQTFNAPNVDFEMLLGAGSTMPMFETVQPVLIRDVGRFTGRKQEEFLRIVKQSSPSTKWLLTTEEIDKRTTFYKTLAALGPVEIFPRIYPDQLNGWVKRIAADFDASLSTAAIELTASVHGADLFGVRQTLERATLYIGHKRRVEASDIELVLAGEGEYDVFQLLEAASRSDLARSIAIAKALSASGDVRHDASIWLGMIHGQCLRYLQILELAGKSNEQIGQELHIHPFLISKLRTQAADFGYEALVAAVETAFEIDWILKTSTLPPQTAWELFVWKISRGEKFIHTRLLDLEAVQVVD